MPSVACRTTAAAHKNVRLPPSSMRSLALAATLAACSSLSPSAAPRDTFDEAREASPRFYGRLEAEHAWKSNGTHDKYGLIVCGRDEERFENDAKIAYAGLRAAGFPERNIYVLTERGRDLPGLPVDGRASAVNVGVALLRFQDLVDDKDVVAIAFADHGMRLGPFKPSLYAPSITTHALCLSDSRLLEKDFRSYLRGIRPALGVLVVDACYGADFIHGHPWPWVGFASALPGETAYSDATDSFSQRFFGRLQEDDPVVTLAEQFEAALRSKWVTGENRAGISCSPDIAPPAGPYGIWELGLDWPPPETPIAPLPELRAPSQAIK